MSGILPVMNDHVWKEEKKEHDFEGFMAAGDDIHFTEDVELGFKLGSQEDNESREPTTSHYVNKKDRTQCSSRKCHVKFSMTTRPHHCRRCGDVFCRNCLRYRRKLNRLAQLDPDGTPWKVCYSCFEVGIPTVGCSRSVTDEFKEFRRAGIEQRRQTLCSEKMADFRTSVFPAFWREQFSINIQKECRRLVDGFKAAVTKSETTKAMNELKTIVKVPSWQKSTYWKLEKQVEFCRVCHGKLGVRKTLRNCKVCGMAMCKVCAVKELLVYTENNSEKQRAVVPKLAIIRVVGSPEKEPDVSVLLHVCEDCKKDISKRQSFDPEWLEEKPNIPDVTTRLAELDEELAKIIERITTKLRKYQDLLEPPEAENPGIVALVRAHISDPDPTIPGKVREIRTELDTDFSRLETLCRRLRSIHSQSSTSAQAVLVKNYIKCKYDFYVENKSIMGRLIRRNQSIMMKRKKKWNGDLDEPSVPLG